MSTATLTFDGFDLSSYTRTPDALFDVVLGAFDLTAAEIRVMLYVIRRTVGFGKAADAISYSQFLEGITARDGQRLDHGCGIKDRTTLTQAIRALEDKGLLAVERRTSPTGQRFTNVYRLPLLAGPEGVVGKPDQGSRDAPPEVVGKPDQQETDSDQQQTDHDVVVDLRLLGVNLKTAKRLSHQHSEKHIREKIALLQQQGNVARPAAWLVAAIRDDYQPAAQPEAPVGHPGRTWAPFEYHRVESEPDLPPDAPERVVQWWKTAHRELQLQMPKETFEAWLRNARLLSGRDEGEVVSMVIGVQSEQAREWLEHRLNRVIERALTSIAKRPVNASYLAQTD